MNEWSMRGKERDPKETIARAEGILRSLGLKTRMRDLPLDVENCYSCRLSVDSPIGEFIATNGKGMSPDLCHASAYGELMERLSNRIFAAMPRFDDPRIPSLLNDRFPLYDVWSAEQPFTARFLKERIAKTIEREHPIFSREYQVSSLLEQLAPTALNGKHPTLPFYSVGENRTEFVPAWITLFTGSNGMAAGNTTEEALVEGFSEILERYAQMQIFDGKIIPPEIPREFIARYPHILKIIENIEARGRYRVRVLDCSLGQGLPVVCGVIIDLETGGFGAKFGSQPHIAVALERVFTEAMQGSLLEQFANYSRPDFSETSPERRLNKWNSMKVASSAMPAQLLMESATCSFVPWGTEEGRSNREVVRDLVRLIEGLGFRIYVRDASYLGFPAVYIYIPGMSEVLPVDFLELKEHLLSYRVNAYLTRVERLTDAEVKDMAVLAAARRGSVIENSMNAMGQLFFSEKPVFSPFDADLLYAACLYRLGRFREAAGVFAFLDGVRRYMKAEDGKLVPAVRVWMEGLAAGKDPKLVAEAVGTLYPDQAEKVQRLFGDPAHVLEKLYPACGGRPCPEITEAGCRYNEVFALYQKLYDAERNHPFDPESLRQVFRP